MSSIVSTITTKICDAFMKKFYYFQFVIFLRAYLVKRKRLSSEKDGQQFILELTGSYNFKEAVEQFDDIGNYYNNNKFNKLLIDLSEIEGNIPIIDRFNLGEIFVKKLAPLDKTAIISNQSLASPDNFFQTVARNRGANVKIFMDKKEASDWLDE